MASKSSLDVHLLLIGKTGSGKSATGNTILGRQEFAESDGDESMTSEVSEAWTEKKNFTVKVVDGPGMGDTRLTNAKDIEKASENFSKAMLLCDRGFNALLMVFMYPTRFNEDEMKYTSILKGLFGENVVRDYCICIMTNGDTFRKKKRRESTGQTFMDWCKVQSGGLSEILKECQYRCVLFENLTDDPDVKARQMSELLQLVDDLRRRRVRYTNAHFVKAHAQRERLVIEAKAPQLKEEISKKTSLLLEALNRVQEGNVDFEQTEKDLGQLKLKVDQLLQEIALEDKGTGLLNSLKDTVIPIQKIIKRHEMILQQWREGKLTDEEMATEREEWRVYEEDVRKVHKEGIDWARIGKYVVKALAFIIPVAYKLIKFVFFKR